MNVMNYGKCGGLTVKWEFSKTTHFLFKPKLNINNR